MIFFGIILHRQAGAYGLSFVSAARLGLMSGPCLALSSPRFALMAAKHSVEFSTTCAFTPVLIM
jgi:hypothetical protein